MLMYFFSILWMLSHLLKVCEDLLTTLMDELYFFVKIATMGAAVTGPFIETLWGWFRGISTRSPEW